MQNIIFYNNEKQIMEYNQSIFLLINIFLKIFFFFVLLSFKKLIISNNHIIVEIDNKINETLYEDDIDFSQYSTKIKVIAIYYPQFIYFNNNYIYNNKKINEWRNVVNAKPKFNKHKQPRNINWKIRDLINKNFSKIEYIKFQIKLAKSHGIYAFAINYYWFSEKKLYDEPINLFLYNKEINFPFFLIWKNDKYTFNSNKKNESIIIEQNFSLYETFNFIKDIKKYLISKYYLKINKRPILGIYDPLIIPNLTIFISYLRKHAKKVGIGNLYILGTMNENLKYNQIFDANFEFPPKNINMSELLKNENYYYYQGLIYKDNIRNINNNDYSKYYKGVILEYDNSPEKMKNYLILNEYSPEKFYLLINKIINSNKLNNKNNFLFINGWNNWKEGTYLEPDDQFGFASINALSKALFNISFIKDNYNLINLKINCKVAIQAHIFYEDLIVDIINKINNIPIKFDLFISTTSIEIRNTIKNYIIRNSKANKYEIILFDNKGRDVLPFLIQLKGKVKQYKYLCHIHSKKSKINPELGISWRNYLYNNLLGNERIVSEILSDFENNEKIGFIFPDTFYGIINEKLILTKKNRRYMRYLLRQLFPNYRIGDHLDFPAGNMFWAKTNAIYQIFDITFNKKFYKEKGQFNDTIMHGIERIWLYLVKLNGYYYKTIFKIF